MSEKILPYDTRGRNSGKKNQTCQQRMYTALCHLSYRRKTRERNQLAVADGESSPELTAATFWERVNNVATSMRKLVTLIMLIICDVFKFIWCLQ